MCLTAGRSKFWLPSGSRLPENRILSAVPRPVTYNEKDEMLHCEVYVQRTKNKEKKKKKVIHLAELQKLPAACPKDDTCHIQRSP